MATQLTILTAASMVVTPTANAADATGNYVTPPGSLTQVLLRVANGGGSPINVVIDDPTTAGPVGATSYNPDVTVTVPAGAQRYIQLSALARFKDPATGRINWTYSATPTSVTVEVVGL